MSHLIATPKILNTSAIIPIMAALPYHIMGNDADTGPALYDPLSQLMLFAGGRNYSTCRYDESVGFIFTSKSDTQKDD